MIDLWPVFWLVLIISCIGEPDLLDALISHLMPEYCHEAS